VNSIPTREWLAQFARRRKGLAHNFALLSNLFGGHWLGRLYRMAANGEEADGGEATGD
jgi:hypothetical protein